MLYYECKVSYYERHLPHWQPEGAAQFITWRQHGSLPRKTELLGNEFVTLDRELDRAATGPRWLQDERAAQCVLDALHHGEHPLNLYELQPWVIMPNHVHVLIDPHATLARITKSIKNYSARPANALLNRTGHPFWQDESYDRWVRDRTEFTSIDRKSVV